MAVLDLDFGRSHVLRNKSLLCAWGFGQIDSRSLVVAPARGRSSRPCCILPNRGARPTLTDSTVRLQMPRWQSGAS